MVEHVYNTQSVLKLRIRKLRVADPKTSGKFPMSLGIPPLKIKNLLGSNPLKSKVFVS